MTQTQIAWEETVHVWSKGVLNQTQGGQNILELSWTSQCKLVEFAVLQALAI